VIHLEKAINRLKNIEELKNKLNCDITLFNAIDGYDMLEITEEGVKFKTIKINAPYTLDMCIKDKLYPGEIGNYFSHLSLLYSIKELNLTDGYSIIFEDDIFINSDLDNTIRGILGKLNDNFDILYLGNTKNNFSEKYLDEIYYIDKTKVLWGTYGYIINNKNINNFYEKFSYFNSYTDIIIKNLIIDNQITAFVINPCIVIQNFKEFPSQIIRKKSNIILKYLKNIKIKK
jgi:GR25 family glycosyltransferase involved in LPS biosynthesis